MDNLTCLCLQLLKLLSLEQPSLLSVDLSQLVQGQSRLLGLLLLPVMRGLLGYPGVQLRLLCPFQDSLRLASFWAAFVVDWWSIPVVQLRIVHVGIDVVGSIGSHLLEALVVLAPDLAALCRRCLRLAGRDVVADIEVLDVVFVVLAIYLIVIFLAVQVVQLALYLGGRVARLELVCSELLFRLIVAVHACQWVLSSLGFHGNTVHSALDSRLAVVLLWS